MKLPPEGWIEEEERKRKEAVSRQSISSDIVENRKEFIERLNRND